LLFLRPDLADSRGIMYSVKPGRGPSGLGAVSGIVAVIFGIFWTILAYSITRDVPFPGVAIFFPLFGVLFTIAGVVRVIYNFSNATRKDRFSVADITTDEEEPDPLNLRFGQAGAPRKSSAEVEARLKELDLFLARGTISPTEHAAQRERILREI
jgi:uncharacterized membrane protein HdeD (DUF308 family)